MCPRRIQTQSKNIQLHLVQNKSVLFGYKWKISAPGIVTNNPKIIDLFIYKFYGGPLKSGSGIVNYNPRHTYCPLVPKQYTFNATKGSLQLKTVHAPLEVPQVCKVLEI